jgi:hypothetical protein
MLFIATGNAMTTIIAGTGDHSMWNQLPCIPISIMNKEKFANMKQLLNYLTRLGSRYNLTLSHQEVGKSYIIGLDGVQKKLLVVSGFLKGRLHHQLIDLNEVISCSVKKYYGKINVNGLKNRALNQYLNKIDLQLEFHSKKQPADILFYKRTENDLRELPELELKARKWMELLSEIIPGSLKKWDLPLTLQK